MWFSWLEKDLSAVPSFNPVLDEKRLIDLKIREAKQYWTRHADSDRERNKIERMYELLSYYIEKKYSKAYASVHGEDYIMTRIFYDKCKKHESLLNFLQ